MAKFLQDNGVVAEALDTALFDLALVGASTFSPNKGGLDLRAISDRDMISFIRLQGGKAKSLNAFIDISNRFRRNLISRNRNALGQLLNNTNLLKITDENDAPDEKRIEALTANVNKTLAELDGYETKYQESYTYGLGNPGFTKDYDLATQTDLEGTFRTILNTYTSLRDDPVKLNAYYDNLKINLSEEELTAFKIFLKQAPQAGN